MAGEGVEGTWEQEGEEVILNVFGEEMEGTFDGEEYAEEDKDAARFFEPYGAPLKPVDGKITLEILVDRTMVEVFANNGRYYFVMGAYLVDNDPAIKVFSKGGKTKLKNLEIYELNSIWH